MEKWGSEKSWERQPTESVQAYEAFDIYLKMGIGRSCHKVALQLSKSDTIIKRWSSAWNWQKRVRDHDAELRRIEFEEARKAVKKMQERQIQTAMLLQKKAVQALDKLDAGDMSAQEILRFITEGAKLESATRAAVNAEEAGNSQKTASIAETIIEAYRQRRETEGSND